MACRGEVQTGTIGGGSRTSDAGIEPSRTKAWISSDHTMATMYTMERPRILNRSAPSEGLEW